MNSPAFVFPRRARSKRNVKVHVLPSVCEMTIGTTLSNADNYLPDSFRTAEECLGL